MKQPITFIKDFFITVSTNREKYNIYIIIKLLKTTFIYFSFKFSISISFSISCLIVCSSQILLFNNKHSYLQYYFKYLKVYYRMLLQSSINVQVILLNTSLLTRFQINCINIFIFILLWISYPKINAIYVPNT